jgi:GDPmannose 4,6-dehydratase
MKKALITGVTGQDGSYLAELLLDKGYEVHGIVRRSSSFNTGRIDHLIRSDLHGKRFFFHWGDLTDASNLNSIVQRVRPDEVYNLGAQSHVQVSFEVPEWTADVDGMGAMRLLEAVRNYASDARVYQASTSEMFGGMVDEMPSDGFDERTPFHPRSPYGVAKLYAYWITRNYREAYGLYACNGILFNHESPRRGETFVTRKITRWFGEVHQKLINDERDFPWLELGNLNAVRDWGHARDAVEAQWLIMQQPQADDYVVATGETHSVREFVEACFSWLDLELFWEGEGSEEVGIVRLPSGSCPVVRINPRYFRPSEVDYLKGDARRIRALGWEPRYSFDELVNEMMRSDCHKQEGSSMAFSR